MCAVFFAAFFGIALVSQAASAEERDVFKGADFLTWKRESQDFYIRTSIGMAGLIASRNDKAHGDCLSDWYFTDESAANEEILSIMRQYPDYHPRGVIVAVMEKKCGSIIYSQRN